jgi:YidC/Oxa1 family membrane protein insertase
MERRVLLAIFLAFLTLYLWQALFMPAPPQTDTGAGAPVATSPAPAAPASTPRIEAPPATDAAPGAPAATPVLADTAERDIRIETRDVVATFTNRGARLKSWRFKKYQDSNGEPFELVPDLAGSHALPFSLRADDDAITRTLNGALYTVQGAPPGGELTSPATVTFEYRDNSGLQAVKEFSVDPSAYVVSLRVAVRQGDRELGPAVEWGPGVGREPAAAGQYVLQSEGILSIADEEERIPADDVAAQPTRQGDFQFAGIEDHYFLVAALYPGPAAVTFQPVTAPPPAGSEEEGRQLMAFTIDPERREEPFRFYIGPKDFDQLAAVDRSLVRAINFGMFAILVVPLLRALNWINGYVGNYGWSIILLTIVINAIMFPLRHKSVVSMRKMQAIQPEAKAIQDRYKNLKATDPAKQKMNQELMALYRERGVNPASGCVPMLMTLPVLLAFYSLLSTAIELRGAPFIGWIQDLSQYDPYYVTPVLMGITQVWQQRLTPQTGVDPAQQKLMMFMPVLFMFIMVWTPAGVVLYWFMSNLWGIGQQYLTNYLIGPPKVHQVRPPAERRVKKVGSGKTDAAADK